ncbi:MAG: putative integral rane protein [Candidatus Saccharibacteria bacterium]|nr:putative integral rane protein [Candidatus Saccharibacteria bacterium]
MHFLSPYILAAVISWIVAQGLKYVVASIKGKKFHSLNQLYLSGSMPSAHSASVVSLLVVIGFRDGVNSAVFGLALLFAAVVMYDAIMVRRSSGEQGTALVELIRELKRPSKTPIHVAKGHTPSEIIGGIIVGLVIGVVVYFATVS